MKFTLLKALVLSALIAWAHSVDCDPGLVNSCDDCTDNSTGPCKSDACKPGFFCIDGVCPKCHGSCLEGSGGEGG